MFKKIGSVSNDDITILKKQIEFSTRPDNKEWFGIRYYDVNSPHLKVLYNLIPKEVHQDFYASLLVINDDLPAHTDIVETACFNCYIRPGGYTTSFYDSKTNAVGITYADHGEGHTYDLSDLIFKGSFQAQPLEIYLINNKMIHGVLTDEVAKPSREVLQLATNKYSYDEVCGMLNGMDTI